MNSTHKFILLLGILILKNVYADLPSEELNLTTLVKKHKIVFVGENHGLKNHKELAISYLEAMEKNPELDTFAFEHGYAENQPFLDEFLIDKSATPGTLKELYHICRISRDPRSVGGRDLSFQEFIDSNNKTPEDLRTSYTYDQRLCGTWQQYNFLSHSLDMFRKMREMSLRKPKNDYKFCAIDHFQDTPEEGIPRTIKRFKKLLRPLNKETLSLFFMKYGHEISQEEYEKGKEIIFDSVRDFKMASNLKSCLKNRKGALVLAGAFHSEDSSYLVNNEIVDTLKNLNTKGVWPSKKLSSECKETCSFVDEDHPQEYFRTTLVEVFKNLLGAGKMEQKIVNLVIFNRNSQDHYMEYPFFKPIEELLTKYSKSKDNFLKIRTSVLPISFKSYMRDFGGGTTYYEEGSYDYMILAPSTQSCDEELCTPIGGS